MVGNLIAVPGIAQYIPASLFNSSLILILVSSSYVKWISTDVFSYVRFSFSRFYLTAVTVLSRVLVPSQNHKSPWVFSTPGWTVPALPSLSSHERCSSPLIIFASLHWSRSRKFMSIFDWEPSTELSTHRSSSVMLMQSMEEGPPSSVCWQYSSQSKPLCQDVIGCLCCKDTSLAHGQLCHKN